MQLHKQKDENYGYQIVGTDWKDRGKTLQN